MAESPAQTRPQPAGDERPRQSTAWTPACLDGRSPLVCVTAVQARIGGAEPR